MPKANTAWKVLPHGPIEKLDEGLWRVQGDVEGMPLKRVMTIARRADGDLVVHGAMCLEESAMKEIESFGRVAYIVVPNGWHRLDAPPFKARYPQAKIVGPKGSKKKIEEVVPLELTYEEVPPDANVQLRTLGGLAELEGVMIVKTPSGVTLVFTDALFNMPHLSGFHGFVLKHITQSSGGPRASRIFRMFMLKDKAAYRADLEALAQTPGLKRVIVAHHETIEGDAAGTLRKVASTI